MANPANSVNQALQVPVAPESIATLRSAHESQSTGTAKKAWGGVMVGLGSVALIAAVAAIAIPFFVDGAPNILNLGKNLGNGLEAGGNAVSFSVTTGALVAGGTVAAGVILLIGGSVLINKGRNDAQKKEELAQQLKTREDHFKALAQIQIDNAFIDDISALEEANARLRTQLSYNVRLGQAHRDNAASFCAQLEAAQIQPIYVAQVPNPARSQSPVNGPAIVLPVQP